MTSIFQISRQNQEEQPEEINPIFSEIKRQRKKDIIPPIGMAKPEIVEEYTKNMEDEQKLLQHMAEIEAYEKETPLKTMGRETASNAARGLEGFFGGLGAFMNMMTPELWEDEEGMPYGPDEGPEGFPSAQKLHEFTKEKTGNYLEPKNSLSEATQEITSDIGSMFSTPGLGALTKILAPIGGQATKQLIKSSGGDIKAQEYGKLGFMTLSTIANLGNAPKVASQAMNEAKDMIPRGVSFLARPTERSLTRVKNMPWYKTGSDASKAPAFQMIKKIENRIQNGMIDAHEAMQLRHDLNNARKALGGFQINPVPDKKGALRYLDMVDDALISSMENYGRNVNPNWWKNYKLANEAFRVTSRSRSISDFIQQHAKPMQSETAKTLMHIGGAAAITKLPAIATAAAPIAATAKTIQIMNRMVHSPILRSHYIDVLRQASTGNAVLLNEALEKFDREALRQEKQKKINRKNLPVDDE